MATNAERQKAFRQRLKAARDRLHRLLPNEVWLPDWLEDDPHRGLDALLFTLRELVLSDDSKTEASVTAGDAEMYFEVTADLPEEPEEDGEWNIRRNLLSSAFTAWTGPAVSKLWRDGEPVRLQVVVRALVDKRKLKAAQRRLEREEERGIIVT
jgi:hypothetical protein